MSSPDASRKSIQAGEYVLGTLEDSEVNAFNALLEEDPELEQMVVNWQEEFQPVAGSVKPVEPPATVWQQLVFSVRRELRHNQLSGNTRSIHNDNIHSGVLQPAVSNASQRERTGWQIFASLATAASVTLGLLLLHEHRKPEAPSYDSIAIITDENNAPLWIVDVSPESDQLRIVAVAVPEIASDRDHQLWMVKPDNTGVISLGLLPDQSNTSRFIRVEGLNWDAQSVAVSLEPAGGSKQQGPSGPVLFQGTVRLLQTVSP